MLARRNARVLPMLAAQTSFITSLQSTYSPIGSHFKSLQLLEELNPVAVALLMQLAGGHVGSIIHQPGIEPSPASERSGGRHGLATGTAGSGDLRATPQRSRCDRI